MESHISYLSNIIALEIARVIAHHGLQNKFLYLFYIVTGLVSSGVMFYVGRSFGKAISVLIQVASLQKPIWHSGGWRLLSICITVLASFLQFHSVTSDLIGRVAAIIEMRR